MKTKEQEAAALLEKLNGLFEGDGSLATVAERLKLLESNVDELKGMDLKGAIAEFDKLKTQQEMLVKAIRTTRSGVYVPGLEDQADRFSLVRCLTGIVRGKSEKDWSNVGAEHERQVLAAVHSKAAQAVGEDSLGGYFVPDQVIPEVIAAIYTASVMISLDGEGSTLASVISGLVGGNVKVPKFDGGTLAYWIGEQEQYTESNASVGEITMNPKKAGVLVRLTDAMMRFGGYGFETLLRRDITKAAAKLIDFAVMYGSGGDNQPRGVAYTPGIKVYSAQAKAFALNNAAALTALLADWQGAELDFDGLDNMDLSLEEDDITADSTFRTVFSPRYRRRLGQLKVANYGGQATQMAYMLGAPMMSDARIADLIGPFSKFNQIGTQKLPGAAVNAPTTSAVTKFSDVLRGNLGEILVGRWGGIEVESDRGMVNFKTDHTLLKLRLYIDAQVRQPRALVLCPDARVRD